MDQRAFIASSRRLLPNLESVRELLQQGPDAVLRPTVGAAPAPPTPASRTPSPFETLEVLREEDASPLEAADGKLPQEERVATALQEQREAVLEAGHRAVQRVMDQGDEAVLTPVEAMGLEAIVLLVGRPALLIQDGRFPAPPADWQLLEPRRPEVQETFKSVGRIDVDGHPNLEWIGTGFLVGPDVVMTNRHVALEFTGPRGDGRWGIRSGMRARIDFLHEKDSSATHAYQLTGLIGIHNQHDLALFRVARTGGPDGIQPLPTPLPLSSQPRAAGRPGEQPVYVVGYPAWDGRRNDPANMLRIFEGIFNVKRLQPGYVMQFERGSGQLTHDCSTLGGNSGSSVLDFATGQVLGLHFGGLYRDSNRAIPLWELSRDPLIQLAQLNFV